jgi:hypothetical protein
MESMTITCNKLVIFLIRTSESKGRFGNIKWGGRANHVVQKTYALKGQIYLGNNKKIKSTSQLHGSNHL